jgi:hypothetical protein
MIRRKPALGLDPGVDTGFPKRSCSIKDLEQIREIRGRKKSRDENPRPQNWRR